MYFLTNHINKRHQQFLEMYYKFFVTQGFTETNWIKNITEYLNSFYRLLIHKNFLPR